MDSKRTFTTPNKELCSSDYTQNLRSKTKYSTSANLAKTMVDNGGSLPMTDNNVIKTYKGPYTFSSTDLNNPNGVYCINQSKSYEDLLDITKGKYLLTPQRLNSTYITKDNLQVSQLYNSVFFDFDYEGPALQLTLPSPGVPENTIVYDNTTDNQQLINVDNTYALFYNSKDNCYSSLFNFGYITLNNRTIDAVLAMRRIQIHNLLNGFTYPRKFALETCLNPVNDVNYDTFIPIIITNATNVNTLSNTTLDITWYPPVLNGEVLINGAYRILYSGPTSGEIITNNTYCSLPIPFAQGVQYNIYVQKQYPTVTGGGIQYFTSLELIAPLVISSVVGGSGSGATTDVTFDWLPPTLGGQLLTPGGYNIYKNGSLTPVNPSPITATTYTITGVDKTTQSSIYVVGLDSGGTEIFESQTLLAPLIITSAVGVGAGNTDVMITWLPPTLNGVPVTTGGYKIYKDSVVIVTLSSPTAMSHTITGLGPNAQSNIYVVGLDSGGNEIFTSQLLVAPLVITSATSVSGPGNTIDLTINWLNPTLGGVIITTGGYKIYYGSTFVTVPSSTATSHLITGLDNTTQGNIYVEGLIGLTPVFNSQILLAPLVITSATSVSGPGNTIDLTINWLNPTLGGVIITTGGYKIYYGSTFVTVPSSTATSHLITGLDNTTQGNIYVEGLIGLTPVFNSQILLAPLVITSATSVSGPGNTIDLTINWLNPTLGGVIITTGGYKIYYGSTFVTVPSSTATSHLITGLDNTTQGNIYVEGLVAGGTFCSQILVAPLVITSATGGSTGGSTTDLTIYWSPPTLNVVTLITGGYKIYKDGLVIATVPSSAATSHTITGLDNTTQGNIYVEGLVAGGTFCSQILVAPLVITSATGGSTGGSTTDLTIYWSPPTLNVGTLITGGYKIYKNGLVIATVPSAATSHMITGLDNTTQGNIYVEGLVAGGTFCSQILVAPLVITSATGGSAAGNTTDLTIYWSPPTLNVVTLITGGYKIYKDGLVIATVPSSAATSHTITGLDNTTQGNIYVEGLVAGGTFCSQILVAPLVITSVVDGSGSGGTTDVTIYWSPPTLNTGAITTGGYNIYKDGLQLNTSAIPVTYYLIPGLGPNAQSSIYVEGLILTGGTFYSQILVAPLVITSTVINYINGINITWLPPTLGGSSLVTSGYDISYNSVPGTSITSPISGEISVTASTTTHTIPLNHGLLYNIYVTGGTFVSQTIQDTIIIPEVILYNNPKVFPKSSSSTDELGIIIGIPSSGLNPLTGFSNYTSVIITNVTTSNSVTLTTLASNFDKYYVYGESTGGPFITALSTSTALNIAQVSTNAIADSIISGAIFKFEFSGGTTSPTSYTCYYDSGSVSILQSVIASMYYSISTATISTVSSKGRFNTKWKGYNGTTNSNTIQEAWGITATLPSTTPTYAPLIQTVSPSPPNQEFYPETNTGTGSPTYNYYNGIPKMITPNY